MRRLFAQLFLLLWLVGAAASHAQSYGLTDGTSVAGELISADERGAVFRTPEGQTLDRVPWIKFSQDALKALQKSPKAARHVEPFLDVDVSKKAQKREVKIREWEKPSREAAGSFLGGFFSTGLGLLILFLAYGASIYAGYEIAIVRAYPWPLVCGIAAVVPILGPLVFLCLPTRVVSHETEGEGEWKNYDGGGVMDAAAADAEAAAAAESGAPHAEAEAPAAPAMPATERYPRGQFTFNRRFFETKFPSWFTVVRRDADKELVIIFKTSRGTFMTTRFSRITANDITLQVTEGSASRDVVVPYQEVQEVMLKHKDSPDR
jgi:hypothetical protein